MNYKIKNYRCLPLKAKLLMFTSGVIVTVALVISIIIYSRCYMQAEQLLKTHVLAIAKSASYLVDADRFQTLSYSQDEQDTYYQELLTKLSSLNQDIGEGMLYIIADQQADQYTYIVDGSMTVGMGFMQGKEDFPREAVQAFKDGRSYVSNPYYFKKFKKRYLSAGVPIITSDDQIAGIMAYDYDGIRGRLEIMKLSYILVMVTIFLIASGLVINYLILRSLFRPMERLVSAIEVVAEGDMTVQIDVTYEDEIGKIANAVNSNIRKISKVLSQIKFSSEKVTTASKSILLSSKDAIEAYEEVADCIQKMAETISKQLKQGNNCKEKLEQLSDKGQEINDEMNKISELLVDKGDDLQAQIEKQIQNVRITLQQMAHDILLLYNALIEAQETAVVLDDNIMAMAAVTQQQIATSDEFSMMASMLREQAKHLDHGISKFKIDEE